jgi:polar amino acid transport system substrate-binding protein
MDTAALITALDQGKVDFIMTGLSITAERQQKIAMIPYQGKPITSYPLVFWKQIPSCVQTIEDLARAGKATVCVEAGSSQDAFLKQYEDRIIIKRIAPSLAILDLMYDKSTAVLLEEGLLGEFKKKYPDLVALEIPLDEQNVVLGNGIGVNKTNTALIQNIERIIQELKTEGFLAVAEQRWFEVSS